MKPIIEISNTDLNQLDLGFLTFWVVGSELIGSITEGQNTPEDLSMPPLFVVTMRISVSHKQGISLDSKLFVIENIINIRWHDIAIFNRA